MYILISGTGMIQSVYSLFQFNNSNYLSVDNHEIFQILMQMASNRMDVDIRLRKTVNKTECVEINWIIPVKI